MKPIVHFQDLGNISYQQAWDYQTMIHKKLVDLKIQNRKSIEEHQPLLTQEHYLLFCEHPPVYTLGKSGSIDNLLLTEEQLEANEIEFFKINRGGDITFHGLGQLVAYPIFDLDCFFTDVHKYVRFLEEVVIRTLAEYGIEGSREKDYTGVWIDAEDRSPKRKICAIGVHLSRWTTMHGFAFNINTDLKYFNNIIACGITDENKTVTSLSKELNRKIDMEEVKQKIKYHFQSLFDFQFI
ncbi:MAG: lipoyl(octanoyl) transferase LipB [Saprospiraceae bacterium]